GRCGEFFRGRQTPFGNPVTVQVLYRPLSSYAAAARGALAEAARAARLGHESIALLLDAGFLQNGRVFLVLERLEGETLADKIRRLGRLPVGEVVPWVGEVLDALALAHSAGSVHGVLTPGSIFVRHGEAGPRPVILDFGVGQLGVRPTPDA